MRVHSEGKIKELKELRSKGYSINELVEKLSMPKTTVWHHVQGVVIDSDCISILYSKRGGSTKRLQKRLSVAADKAQEMLKGKSKNYCIALAMLYWGEGSKKACEFINSDGRMIQVYLLILRNIFKIAEGDLKVTVRIFTGMDQEESLEHWGKITNISRDKFTVRLNDGGTRGKTKYGMCRITVRKGSNTLRLLHALREQIFKEIMEQSQF